MKLRIALLPGDGIGPEVVAAARSVLEGVAGARGHRFEFEAGLIGGAAIDATGGPLPPATVRLSRTADAVLLGAVGGPRWSGADPAERPEAGLLGIRRALGLFANLRPVAVHPRGAASSPLRADLLQGVDLLIVRELTGGIYFGRKTRTGRGGAERATDSCAYSAREIARVVRVAARAARARRGRITSVDKANVLETSRLWRRVTERVVTREFPDLRLDHLLVDTCAMELVRRPASFDVIVTENMFGDILSDEAAVLAGSIGLLPSASLGARGPGLFEPIHGSAPDLAGRGVANPIGTILSAALLLQTVGLLPEASAIQHAVRDTLDRGIATPDVAGADSPANTARVTAAVLEFLTTRLARTAGDFIQDGVYLSPMQVARSLPAVPVSAPSPLVSSIITNAALPANGGPEQ